MYRSYITQQPLGFITAAVQQRSDLQMFIVQELWLNSFLTLSFCQISSQPGSVVTCFICSLSHHVYI